MDNGLVISKDIMIPSYRTLSNTRDAMTERVTKKSTFV